MAMRKPATTRLRNAVVKAFNRGKTQAEVAAALGLTTGVVGRLLAEARAEGTPVVRYSSYEITQRANRSARARVGEDAYCARMAAVRAARNQTSGRKGVCIMAKRLYRLCLTINGATIEEVDLTWDQACRAAKAYGSMVKGPMIAITMPMASEAAGKATP